MFGIGLSAEQRQERPPRHIVRRPATARLVHGLGVWSRSSKKARFWLRMSARGRVRVRRRRLPREARSMALYSRDWSGSRASLFGKPSLSQRPGDLDEKERSCGGAVSGRHTGDGSGAVRAVATFAISFSGHSAIATTTAASPRTACAPTVRGATAAIPVSATAGHNWLRRSTWPVLPRWFLSASGARPCLYVGVGKRPFWKRLHLGDRDCAQRVFRGHDRTRSGAWRCAASCRRGGAVHRRPE
jgi:hypothetical protein